jgi:sugar phosphate isomerase/epimerase
MSLPIGLQSYTVRHLMREDAHSTLQRIADIGYVGVEVSLTDETGEPTTARLVRSLGLQVPSALTGFPFVNDRNRAAMDELVELGCQYVGIAFYPPAELKTVDGIKKLCALLNEADDLARQHGLTMIYHNHWAECEALPDGRTPLEILFENTNPTVQFEIDIYWAQTGGSDPVQLVRSGGARVPLLHVKDGPAVRGKPMVAAGEGSVDIPSIVKAGEGSVKWLIVELDECATDMMEAVEKSYRYLVATGLGHGRQTE